MADQEKENRLKSNVGDWNRWRVKQRGVPIDLRGADLSGAKLKGANFKGVNLSEANLNGADLRGVKLIDANLRQAKLIKADLRGANLTRAELLRANLSKANLSDVNLSDANLKGANLNGVDLSGATLKETIFADVDLTTSKNLESCKHKGPSTIDLRTLEKSSQLPDVFLRGCGLSDRFIEYYPSLLNQAIEFYSCFISYSHADYSYARRLHDALQGRGIRCWLDEYQMLPGDDIYERVDQGIRLWDKVLLCASENSLNSWWVDSEINRAFEKERNLMQQRGKKVLALIPLNLDGHLFIWEDAKAEDVKSRVAADFTGWENDNLKFETAFEKVVKAMQTEDLGREIPPNPKL